MGAALAGLAVLTAMLPAAPAAADHTPVPQAVTLVGSLQEELGCPGDWQPECAATHLQPVDGQPGVFRGTFDVPAGGYDYKVALNDAWSENYGADGSPGGANIPLTAPGGPVTFTYDHDTHRIVDDSPKPLVNGAAAQWLRRDTIAWDLPEPSAGRNYRLYWAEEGGLTREDGQITGGESAPLTVRSGGLPADLRAQYPHLASYDALVVPDGIPLKDAAHRTGGGRLRRSRWQRRDRDGPATARRPGRPVRRGAQPHPRAHVELGSAASCAVGADRQVR